MGLKPHASIKSDRLRILLVDRKFAYGIVFNGKSQQLFTDPLSSLFGGDEEHFKLLPVDPRKSDGHAVFFCNKQMRNGSQCLRHISLDPFELFFG